MARLGGTRLGAILLLVGGILASTLMAVLAADSGWLIVLAPVVLAASVLSADVVQSRDSGTSRVPSTAALILAGTVLVAGLLTILRDPTLVQLLIPVIGGAGFVPLIRRPERRPQRC